MDKIDYKKDEKAFYLPPAKPVRVTIPKMKFFMISGTGDPNTSKTFSDALQALYSLSFTVKMSPKSCSAPEGYREYTVYPLEGVWDMDDRADDFAELDKNLFRYTLMMRQPDFVSEEYALETIAAVQRKKALPLLSEVTFGEIEEKDCVQIMHIGPFDDEPASFRKLADFLAENGLSRTETAHREIYLSDFRRTAPEKLKTVLRWKVQ